jgi:hypothetical protein
MLYKTRKLNKIQFTVGEDVIYLSKLSLYRPGVRNQRPTYDLHNTVSSIVDFDGVRLRL